MRKKLAIAVVLLTAVGLGVWYWRARDAGVDQANVGETVTVGRGELVDVAAASGTIEPDVQVEVKSRASGEVIEVLVTEGQRVEAGALLVRLDPADAERAVREARAGQRRIMAQLAESKASLEMARLESKNAADGLAVSQRGKDLGLVSSESARTAGYSASLADANITLRKAQLAAAQTQLETAQLDVEEAERRLAESDVYAPIAGTVLSVDVEKGTIVASALTNVSGGTPLMTLADLTELRVIGAIDEAQVGRVATDQPVVVRVDAYPDRSFEGKVTRVSPLGKMETSVVTFDVEIVITDANRELLRSGMSADVEIVTAQHSDVLLVPLASIQSKGAMRFVRMANGEQRPITTGATDGTHIIVLEGLEEGDAIAGAATSGGGPRAEGSGRPSNQSRNMMRGLRQMGR